MGAGEGRGGRGIWGAQRHGTAGPDKPPFPLPPVGCDGERGPLRTMATRGHLSVTPLFKPSLSFSPRPSSQPVPPSGTRLQVPGAPAERGQEAFSLSGHPQRGGGGGVSHHPGLGQTPPLPSPRTFTRCPSPAHPRFWKANSCLTSPSLLPFSSYAASDSGWGQGIGV